MLAVRVQLIILVALFSGGAGIWKCRWPKRNWGTDTPVSKTEIPPIPRKGYNCDSDGGGRQRVTKILGIFVARAGAGAGEGQGERSLPSSEYGVEVLEPHAVDYEELNKTKGLWGDVGGNNVTWVFEPKNISSESRKVTPGLGHEFAEKINVFYQRTSTCGYFDEATDTKIENAVKVFSEPAVVSSGLGWQCKDWLTKDGMKYGDGEYWRYRVDGNSGSHPREVAVSSREGLEDNLLSPARPQSYSRVSEATASQDDTQRLFDEINRALAGIPKPSPFTGLDNIWESVKVTGLGFRQNNFTLVVPPGRAANAYQAIADCGPFRVLGPTLPITFDMDSPGAGICESPLLKPCVTTYGRGGGDKLGTPEASLRWGECTDSFEEVKYKQGQPEIQFQYGIKGPHANKLGEPFKSIFNEMIHKDIGGAKTEFTWKTYDIPDWSLYGDSKATKKAQVPAKTISPDTHMYALQVAVTCGLYTYYTPEVAFAEYRDPERISWGEGSKLAGWCVAVHGLPVDCESVSSWVDDDIFAGDGCRFCRKRVSCDCSEP